MYLYVIFSIVCLLSCVFSLYSVAVMQLHMGTKYGLKVLFLLTSLTFSFTLVVILPQILYSIYIIISPIFIRHSFISLVIGDIFTLQSTIFDGRSRLILVCMFLVVRGH